MLLNKRANYGIVLTSIATGMHPSRSVLLIFTLNLEYRSHHKFINDKCLRIHSQHSPTRQQYEEHYLPLHGHYSHEVPLQKLCCHCTERDRAAVPRAVQTTRADKMSSDPLQQCRAPLPDGEHHDERVSGHLQQNWRTQSLQQIG